MPLPFQTCPTCGGSGVVPGVATGATPDAAAGATPAASSNTSDLERILGMFGQGPQPGAGLDPNSPGVNQSLVPGAGGGKIKEIVQAFITMMAAGA